MSGGLYILILFIFSCLCFVPPSYLSTRAVTAPVCDAPAGHGASAATSSTPGPAVLEKVRLTSRRPRAMSAQAMAAAKMQQNRQEGAFLLSSLANMAGIHGGEPSGRQRRGSRGAVQSRGRLVRERSARSVGAAGRRGFWPLVLPRGGPGRGHLPPGQRAGRPWARGRRPLVRKTASCRSQHAVATGPWARGCGTGAAGAGAAGCGATCARPTARATYALRGAGRGSGLPPARAAAQLPRWPRPPALPCTTSLALLPCRVELRRGAAWIRGEVRHGIEESCGGSGGAQRTRA